MIQFEVSIWTNALSLLKGEKVDIKEEVKNSMNQTDNYDVKIDEKMRELNLPQSVIEAFNDGADIERFITIHDEDVRFDIDPYDAQSKEEIYFLVPCEFDEELFSAFCEARDVNVLIYDADHKEAYHNDLKYITNCTGESVLDIPLTEEEAYLLENIWKEDTGCYSYIVRFRGQLGILITNEYYEYEPEGKEKSQDNLLRALTLGAILAPNTDHKVILAEKAGFTGEKENDDATELSIFLEYNTFAKADYDLAASTFYRFAYNRSNGFTNEALKIMRDRSDIVALPMKYTAEKAAASKSENVKNKQFYKALFDKKLSHLICHFTLEGVKDPNAAALEDYNDGATVDEIVGYYIGMYDTDAYKSWMDNLENYKKSGRTDREWRKDKDEEITIILKSLFEKPEAEDWIIGMSGSKLDDVICHIFTGSKDQAKEHLAGLVREDKDNDIEFFESGDENAKDVSEHPDGRLYAYAMYRNYHMDYTATKMADAKRIRA